MKNRYKPEAKKNMMIERKTVSEVWQRQRIRGSVCGGEAKWDAAD